MAAKKKRVRLMEGGGMQITVAPMGRGKKKWKLTSLELMPPGDDSIVEGPFAATGEKYQLIHLAFDYAENWVRNEAANGLYTTAVVAIHGQPESVSIGVGPFGKFYVWPKDAFKKSY